MAEAAVQLKLAGQTYRVVTTAHEDELDRLVEVVERALAEVTPPGRQPSTQSLVLAAITLAHEVEEERAKRREAEARHKRTLESLLGRIDQVLDESEVVVRRANGGESQHPDGV